MNLSEPQIRHLNSLPTGQAAVHDERIGSAILVKIRAVKGARVEALSDRQVRDLARLAEPEKRAHLRQHAGCHSCASPCDFLTPLEEARGWDRVKRSLTPFCEHLLFGDADSAWAAWNNWRADLRALSGLRLDGGFGIEYCAAAFAVHDWLGAFLESRRALTQESILLPEDRLKREAASRAVGPFLMEWLRATGLEQDQRRAFEQAHQQLVATVAGQPPREEPGCERCPMRCQLLSFTANHVGSLTRQVVPSVMQDPPEKALLSVERATVAAMQSVGAIAAQPVDSPVRNAWLYCLLTNMKMPAPESSAARDRLLVILSERSGLAESKALDVFGSG